MLAPRVVKNSRDYQPQSNQGITGEFLWCSMDFLQSSCKQLLALSWCFHFIQRDFQSLTLCWCLYKCSRDAVTSWRMLYNLHACGMPHQNWQCMYCNVCTHLQSSYGIVRDLAVLLLQPYSKPRTALNRISYSICFVHAQCVRCWSGFNTLKPEALEICY